MGRPQDFKRGEQHKMAKLTEADVIDVLQRIRNGEVYRSIAADKGVAVATIGKIASGRNWPHIDRRPR